MKSSLVRAGVVVLGCAGVLDGQITVRASLGVAGAQADGPSSYPTASATGRFVAFQSEATNLVLGDTNGVADVFVRDLATGTTTRASVDAAGVQGNAESEYPWISADGRTVAFYSAASNLVPHDTNGAADVFVRDLATKTTSLVSADPSGRSGDLESVFPALSADGRHVVFWSRATDLVPLDTNGNWDVFVRDLDAGVTTRVSVATGGAQSRGDDAVYGKASALSADGSVIAFDSGADDLVPADTNAVHDVFVHDRHDGTTIRASVGAGGVQGNRGGFPGSPSLSADGRRVAFMSWSTNLVAGDTNSAGDAFVYDRATATTTRVSIGATGAQAALGVEVPSLSPDGRFVAFRSYSGDLVPGDTEGFQDVFVRNLARRMTTRVSAVANGSGGNGRSNGYPSVAAGGRWVVFHSEASNLVSGDTNGVRDVFVRFYVAPR